MRFRQFLLYGSSCFFGGVLDIEKINYWGIQEDSICTPMLHFRHFVQNQVRTLRMSGFLSGEEGGEAKQQ